MKNFALLCLVIFFLNSCKKDAEYDKAKAVSAFSIVDKIRLDSSLEKTPIIIPPQQKNNFWSGSLSGQNTQIENFAKNFAAEKSFFSSQKIVLKKSSTFWSLYSGRFDNRFVFSPIIKDNKIFILDTGGTLVGLDLKRDKKIWSKRIFPRNFSKNYQTPKIGYGDGKIFAIAGINKIVAVDENDGKILWQKDISSIPVSTPICDENFVYISTNDNKLYALNQKDGELQWLQSGVLRPTAIFGAADLVIYQNLIIAGYSSGEIYAVNKKTGEAAWSNSLNLSKATNSDFYLNDIDATPVVKDGVVYAIGNGGLMMAINATNGNYSWKKEIAGIADFWLAGEFLFVINNDNKLLAIHKKNGGIKWISQLPNFANAKKPQTKFIYSGVVMAGDKLVISRLDGKLLIVSPINGELEKTFTIGKKISHAPIINDGKIYFYTLGKFFANLVEFE